MFHMSYESAVRCPRFGHVLRYAGMGLVTALLAWPLLCCSANGAEWLSGIEWPEPPVIDPGPVGGPPSDAVVLFGGKDLSAWQGGEKWLVKDGVAISRGGGITTKQAFGDCQVHVEWSAPTEIKGRGQGRGNSGVYLMGKYEVQILDSYQNETYFDGQAGAIYKQSPPMVNAMRPPGQWNVYDILFTAPRFAADGSVEIPAYVTVLHNGVVLQNHTELKGASFWKEPPKYEKHAEKLPFSLQFHGNPVRFRNIWVREIKPLVGRRVGPPHNRGD
jgi:hypothetical protein